MLRKYVLILVLIFLFTGFLSAETDVGFSLSGYVGEVIDISVTPDPQAGKLDLLTGKKDLPIAVVCERSNLREGYTVMLSSAYAESTGNGQAAFAGTEENPDILPYSLSYGEEPVVFNSGVAIITSSDTGTGADGLNRQLKISYEGQPDIYEGSYSDTLSFLIAAK